MSDRPASASSPEERPTCDACGRLAPLWTDPGGRRLCLICVEEHDRALGGPGLASPEERQGAPAPTESERIHRKHTEPLTPDELARLRYLRYEHLAGRVLFFGAVTGDGQTPEQAIESLGEEAARLRSEARRERERAEALAAALRGLATHFTVHHRCPATGDCPDCDAIAAADEVLAGSRAARPLPTSVPGHNQPCHCPTCSRSRGEIGEEEYARRRAAHDESRGTR